MSTESCRVSEEQILAYVAGDLQEEEELEIAEHLGDCAACRDEAAEYVALRDALSDCCRGEEIRWHSFRTPFGPTFVAATDEGLCRLSWKDVSPDQFVRETERRFPGHPVVRDPDGLAEAERQIREYFAGERSEFDLPVDLSALTDFERHVLEAARRIPYGEAIPYAELARRIARPGAARAVGNALGRNPVAIVVPCHRVVRSDGGLGGYSGGPEFKERLLTMEGRDDFRRAS